MNDLKLNTSEKVLNALKERGTTKAWLAYRMQMTRPTLYSRIKKDDWSIAEILLLEKLLLIY